MSVSLPIFPFALPASEATAPTSPVDGLAILNQPVAGNAEPLAFGAVLGAVTPTVVLPIQVNTPPSAITPDNTLPTSEPTTCAVPGGLVASETPAPTVVSDSGPFSQTTNAAVTAELLRPGTARKMAKVGVPGECGVLSEQTNLCSVKAKVVETTVDEESSKPSDESSELLTESQAETVSADSVTEPTVAPTASTALPQVDAAMIWQSPSMPVSAEASASAEASHATPVAVQAKAAVAVVRSVNSEGNATTSTATAAPVVARGIATNERALGSRRASVAASNATAGSEKPANASVMAKFPMTAPATASAALTTPIARGVFIDPATSTTMSPVVSATAADASVRPEVAQEVAVALDAATDLATDLASETSATSTVQPGSNDVVVTHVRALRVGSNSMTRALPEVAATPMPHATSPNTGIATAAPALANNTPVNAVEKPATAASEVPALSTLKEVAPVVVNLTVTDAQGMRRETVTVAAVEATDDSNAVVVTDADGVAKPMEKIAARSGRLDGDARVIAGGDTEKNTLNVGQKKEKRSANADGITAAKKDDAMRSDLHSNATGTPKTESALPPADRAARLELAHSATTGVRTTSSAEATPAAGRTLEVVRDVSERMQTKGSRVVEFDLGGQQGERLSVRLEYRGGVMHTAFRTDSEELRTTLARDWSSNMPAVVGSEQTVRIAEPTFTSNASQRSENFDFGGNLSRQQQPRDERQDASGTAFGPALRRGTDTARADTSTSAARDTASRTLRPETAQHLHTFA